MEIFEKRGRWCVSDEQNKLLGKFSTKNEAEDFVSGETSPVEESLDGSTEEEEGSEEEAGTDKQTFVFGSKGSGKKKI